MDNKEKLIKEATKEVVKIDTKNKTLKRIYWEIKQKSKYLVANSEGYGGKSIISEKLVIEWIKQLEEVFEILIDISYIPDMYENKVRYTILRGVSETSITSDGSQIIKSGAPIGSPYAESGIQQISLSKLDSDEKLTWDFEYTANANSLTFLTAIRRTYFSRVNILKWLGISTEEQDPEIVKALELESNNKLEMDTKFKNELVSKWGTLYEKDELDEQEQKNLNTLKSFTKMQHIDGIKKFIQDSSVNKLEVINKKLVEVPNV